MTNTTICIYGKLHHRTRQPATHRALLVVDVQNGVVTQSYSRNDIVTNTGTRVDKARTAGVDIAWVQHNSRDLPRASESWQYAPELVRRDTEPLVQKL